VTSRALELQTLTDPTLRADIDAVRVRLIHYGDIE
jgi:hypothetical protein